MSDFEYTLLDDGTLDTVIEVTCTRCGDSWEERYNLDPEDIPEGEEWDRVGEVMALCEYDTESMGCPHCDGDEDEDANTAE